MLLADLRFEHLDRNADNADEALWRFVSKAHLDRKTDHVPGFMAQHGREPEERCCLIPVEALTVSKQERLLGIALLPTSDEMLRNGDPVLARPSGWLGRGGPNPWNPPRTDGRASSGRGRASLASAAHIAA